MDFCCCCWWLVGVSLSFLSKRYVNVLVFVNVKMELNGNAETSEQNVAVLRQCLTAANRGSL